MNWEKALLKIDVVKDKEDLISAIKGISKNPDEGVYGINDLISKYKEPNHRIFIQKYAETQLATNGIYLTMFAYPITFFTASVSILIGVVALDPINKLLNSLPNNLEISGTVLLVAIFAAYSIAIFLFLYYYVDPRISKYKAIVIAIEAAKLGNQRKNTRDIVELNKKDTKTIALLALFIFTICQSFIIIALIFP